MYKLKVILSAILFLGFLSISINYIVNQSNKVNLKTVEVKSLSDRINSLGERYDSLNKDFQKANEEKTLNKQKVEELNKQKEELEKEKIRLEAELQAKAQNKLQESSVAVSNRITNSASASASSGNKYDWMTQAGIPESDWQYVDYIVSKESGWNPCAYNPSKSDCNANPTSACGLAQSLPCGKQSKYGHWTDPVANLKWQYDYVKGRYGGYAQAYQFWIQNKWY